MSNDLFDDLFDGAEGDMPQVLRNGDDSVGNQETNEDKLQATGHITTNSTGSLDPFMGQTAPARLILNVKTQFGGYGNNQFGNSILYVYRFQFPPHFELFHDPSNSSHRAARNSPMGFENRDLNADNYFSDNSLYSQPSNFDLNPLDNLDRMDFMNFVQTDDHLPHQQYMQPGFQPTYLAGYQPNFQESLHTPWNQTLQQPLPQHPFPQHPFPQYNQMSSQRLSSSPQMRASDVTCSYTWRDLITGPPPNNRTPEWCIWVIVRWMRETSIIANYKHTSSHPKQAQWNKLYFEGFKMPRRGDLATQTEELAGYKRLIVLVKNRLDREVMHAGWILERKGALKVHGRGKRGWGQRVEWSKDTDEWATVPKWNEMMVIQGRPPLPTVLTVAEKDILVAIEENDWRNKGVTRKKGQWHLDWPDLPDTPTSPEKRKRGDRTTTVGDGDPETASPDSPRLMSKREKADAKFFKKIREDEAKAKRLKAAKDRAASAAKRKADKSDTTPVRRSPRHTKDGSVDGEDGPGAVSRQQPPKRARKHPEFTDEEGKEQQRMFAEAAASARDKALQSKGGESDGEE
ncbi:MAG: hypothetical protein MMC33_010215 [Icmadophila ericetorum]|nr:hypothetical protein [Icmadophila ericetorum]